MSLHPNFPLIYFHVILCISLVKPLFQATVSLQSGSYSFATVRKLQFRYSCEATDSLQLKTRPLYLNREEDLDSSDLIFPFSDFLGDLSSSFLSFSLGESEIRKHQGNFPVFRLISHFFCNIFL